MQINDRSDLTSDVDGEITLVNVFTPKAGQMDGFIAAQTSEYQRLNTKVEGWLGNQLHLSIDARTAVNIARFASMANYRAWRESDAFKEHLTFIEMYVERSEPFLLGPAIYGASID